MSDTWEARADQYAEREVDYPQFASEIADLPDQERQAAYADFRCNWTAAARGKSLNAMWQHRRKGVKCRKRSYDDASFATDEIAG